MKTAGQIAVDVLTSAIAEPTRQERTTPPSSGSEHEKNWLAKWTNLKTGHSKAVEVLCHKVYRFCGGVWERPTRGGLLVLAGGNGNGKTTALRAIKRWCDQVAVSKRYENGRGQVQCVVSRFWHWPRLLDELKGGGWSAVDGCIDATVLLLDELGGGYDRSGIGTDKLCQILSQREGRWTAVSTNIMPEHWEEAFDKRVASRFLRKSVIVDLSSAPDWNAKKCLS